MIKSSLLIVAIIIFLTSALLIFRVKNIDLVQNNCLKKEELNITGKFIQLINLQKLEQEIKKNHLCIKQVRLTKKLPHTILVEIVQSQVVVRIASTNLSMNLDGELYVTSDDLLPQLFLKSTENLSPGVRIEDGVALFSANLADSLKKSDFHATNIRIISENEIVVYDSKETVAIFTTKRKVVDQVDSLQQVLALAKIESDKIGKIDLRFDKPVISFK